MKIHTTNYHNTLIEVAEDCKATKGQKPTPKGDTKTVAEMQFDQIASQPYRHTSDDVLFQVFAQRNNIPANEYEEARAAFFRKGQPCFRASPLTKTHGFGVHFDAEGKMALYGMETETYQNLQQDPTVKKYKAMKTSRK